MQWCDLVCGFRGGGDESFLRLYGSDRVSHTTRRQGLSKRAETKPLSDSYGIVTQAAVEGLIPGYCDGFRDPNGRRAGAVEG